MPEQWLKFTGRTRATVVKARSPSNWENSQNTSKMKTIFRKRKTEKIRGSATRFNRILWMSWEEIYYILQAKRKEKMMATWDKERKHNCQYRNNNSVTMFYTHTHTHTHTRTCTRVLCVICPVISVPSPASPFVVLHSAHLAPSCLPHWQCFFFFVLRSIKDGVLLLLPLWSPAFMPTGFIVELEIFGVPEFRWDVSKTLESS